MNKVARVLVIYYSRTGNTEAMAKAVVKGAEREGVAVDLKRVDYATVYDVMAADAFAFGSPCHYGYMAGALKEFFDRMLEPEVLKKIHMKPAAAFASNGEKDGGKEALLSIKRILYNYFVLTPIGDRTGVVCKGAPDKAKLEECESLGVILAKAAVLTEGNQKGTESQ
ncbi:Flavodoxin [subsurface metagenome]